MSPLDLAQDVYPLDPTSDAAQETQQLQRSGCPIRAVELPGAVRAWTATDLASAELVLGHEQLTKDPQAWTAYRTGQIPPDWPLIPLVDGAGFLHKGGEEHARQRRLVAGAFKRAPIKALAPRIKAIADELLDALDDVPATTPVDLKEQFAYPLPVRVICEVLGVPETAAVDLRKHFELLVRPLQDGDLLAAQMAINEAFTELIATKRHTPGDDLTTQLIHAWDQDDELAEAELAQVIFLIVIAGHETTMNLVTNAVHALMHNPDQLAAIRSGTATWDDVVEETLRYASPVRHGLMRYATRDISISGMTIAEGEPVIASMYAAGRDPQHHRNAEMFDVTRPTRRDHVAFGHGAHFCLGAILARQEAAIALEALFERFPDLHAAAEPAVFPSISLYGFNELPVYLTAADRAASRVPM
ncbi:cytochrome P450 family protein [Streptomyces xantholiticus]|uniref:Cytochrome P450 n=1 Tax=Streptomyces xantholiticus TaxID=68285 RepID=A0ABV1V1F8_9ACTN